MEEAFEVFLGGHLVSALEFKVHEAKTIIGDLRKELRDRGLYPGKRYSEARKKRRQILHVHIMRTWGGQDFYCELRDVFLPDEEESKVMMEKGIIVEKYRTKVIAPKGASPDWRNVRVLGVTELLMDFNRRLKGEKGLQGVIAVQRLLELADDLEG
jgi:hypothetical protein